MKNTLKIAALVMAALLSACGGGGGGGGGTATPGAGAGAGTGGGQPTQIFAGIVTTPPPGPTYLDEELIAFNKLNIARNACGFGYLAQDTNLDHAAQNHLAWMSQNRTYTHDETIGTPGYTGHFSYDRATAAGYQGHTSGDEAFTILSNQPKAGFADLGLTTLLGAPYHLRTLVSGHRDVGISVKTGGPIGSGADMTFAGAASAAYLLFDIEASTSSPLQLQDTNSVLTFPCNGITGASNAIFSEVPNPLPSVAWGVTGIGQPILVQVRQGQSLQIITASIVKAVASTPVTILATLTAQNDPNSVVGGNQAIIIPAALTPQTEYVVTINGLNGSVRFTNQFNFTTK